MSISTELRWILIACGVVLLVAIYWWGRRGERGSESGPSYDRVRQDAEPSFDSTDESFAESKAAPGEAGPQGPNEPQDDFDRTVVMDDIAPGDADLESVDWPEVKVHPVSAAGDLESQRERIAAEPRARAVEAPVLNSDTPPAAARSAPRPPSAEAAARAKPAGQRKIVALRLAIGGAGLAGAELLELLQGAGLHHGKFGIFHRMQAGASVFSVASMIEPGTFDLSTMEQNRYPGLTLFMLLPGPINGPAAFDQMLTFAQRLAEAGGGALQDERGKPLTLHAVDCLREEVIDFQHLHGSAEAG